MIRRRCRRAPTELLVVRGKKDDDFQQAMGTNSLHSRVGCLSGSLVAILVFGVAPFTSWDFLSDRILESMFGGPLPPADEPDVMVPMPVVNYGEMTFERFYNEFRKADRPFVMKNVPPDQNPCFGSSHGPFSLSLLKNCTGNVRLLRMVSGSTVRRGLEEVTRIDIASLVNLMSEEGALEREFGKGHYFGHSAHDLPSHCPKLAREIRMPSYFTGQLYLRGARGAANLWFGMATKHLNQTFHVDVPITELSTFVCSGRKLYRIIPRSVASSKLGWGDRYHKKLMLRPMEWPLGLPVYYAEAGPGDFVYAPAGNLHAVDNLEDTFVIVNNVLDTGKLGPVSWVNQRLARAKYALPLGSGQYQSIFDRLSDQSNRTRVYDEQGEVTDVSKIPHGFPTLGQLADWIEKE